MAKTIDQLSIDVDNLSKKLVVIEDALAKITALDSRISELEIKFTDISRERGIILTDIQRVVNELERTDEVSGWKRWKEQNPRGQPPGASEYRGTV